MFVTLSTEGRAAVAAGLGAALGAGQTVLTQQLDANGTFGPAPLPQIGGFGTMGAIIDEVTGVTGLALGLAGAMGKGPLRSHPKAAAAGIGYGAGALVGRTTAVLLDTAAVKVPGAMAKAAAANGGRFGARAGAGGSQALYSGGIAPRGSNPSVSATSYSQGKFS